MEKSKWSVCEIVGHLIPWDKFILEKRLPYLLIPNSVLVKPNVQQMNSRAAFESLNMMKEEVIKQFSQTRLKLVNEMKKIPAEEFNKVFSIGASVLTVAEYFNGLIEHDLHHFQQINVFLYKFDGMEH
ncbi:DinB family protein [Viridibacillus soli]|uniref:DinB family protein n=1 Tax=Viridibacillus soli TaxID=2798301 RepID=UPI002D80B239|nr:DinB family protein [Viridibacillus soli]